ncbi:MAG TPA: prepilin peptidase [Drouetiella sp.]
MLDTLMNNMVGRDILAALIGLCVGSFLNVLALRSLKEESIFWPPSTCPNCKQRIKLFDLIPVVSWFVLQGKCRNCKTPISWMYPFVEVFTACTFALLMHHYAPEIVFEPSFQAWGHLVGMAIFCSTLIAICITDFKEMLIPHEITYPSMLIGVLYSGFVRNDFSGAFIGIGISYMLFDFLAFYGLKFYIKVHGDPDSEEEKQKRRVVIDRDHEALMVFGADEDIDLHVDHAFDVTDEEEDDEEFSVMGGADAVLAAVISAWLGVQALMLALGVGFLAGTVVGAAYLLFEMRKMNLLAKTVKPALLGMTIMVAMAEGALCFVKSLNTGSDVSLPYLNMGILAAICGGLIGVLNAGKGVSKAFPFGPPLAVGAVVAMVAKDIVFPGTP